tara:strand:+ start:1026 stop:1406 length:381 start_codon:yes stop_codon:yes gene_type:complete
MNKVILTGNLGSDPVVRDANGTPVANFSIATSNGKDKDPDWHRIVCFGKRAELAKNYLSKGSKVLIEGKLQTRDWEDNTGARRTQTEVLAWHMEFLSSKPNEQAKQEGYYNSQQDVAAINSGDVPF